MKATIPLLILLTVAACGGVSEIKKSDLPDYSDFFTNQIAFLDSTNPNFTRVHTVDGMPDSQNPDSLDWASELRVFTSLDLSKPGNEDKYLHEIDSSAAIRIDNWYAKDSAQRIRRLSVTTVKGNTELIEAVLIDRGFVVDRDISLSYQPLKGYGIKVWENYIWSKPLTYEVFNTLEAKLGY